MIVADECMPPYIFKYFLSMRYGDIAVFRMFNVFFGTQGGFETVTTMLEAVFLDPPVN